MQLSRKYWLLATIGPLVLSILFYMTADAATTGSPLFWFDKAAERIRLNMATSPKDKANLLIEFAQERSRELEQVKRFNPQLTELAESEFRKALQAISTATADSSLDEATRNRLKSYLFQPTNGQESSKSDSSPDRDSTQKGTNSPESHNQAPSGSTVKEASNTPEGESSGAVDLPAEGLPAGESTAEVPSQPLPVTSPLPIPTPVDLRLLLAGVGMPDLGRTLVFLAAALFGLVLGLRRR